MGKTLKYIVNFTRREAVLCIAALLALMSVFLVPPDIKYMDYIDWNTLSLLFSLMAVIKGFQKAGLFVFLGNSMLKKTSSARSMLFILVFLPFVFSMFITNDVSLITFVPFGITVLDMSGQKRLIVPMAVLQTVAANLGSMLTPIGNPQNLYLYGKSGLNFIQFCLVMLPYVLLSGICIAVMTLLVRSSPVSAVTVEAKLKGPKMLSLCILGFCICLLGLFKIVPSWIIAIVIAAFLLFADREILKEVDYSLLLTFIAFFIFVGNMARIDAINSFLSSVIAHHARLSSVITSQVISNVPAALLLSGFTDQWKELIVGCNLGGLGTLIASMASLISYKLVCRECPEKRGKYLMWFTLCNVLLLAILLGASCLISG